MCVHECGHPCVVRGDYREHLPCFIRLVLISYITGVSPGPDLWMWILPTNVSLFSSGSSLGYHMYLMIMFLGLKTGQFSVFLYLHILDSSEGLF